MTSSTTARRDTSPLTQSPIIAPRGDETQAFTQTRKTPIALGESVREESIGNLNQLLADVITLRDMYKKHHWQVSGPTFYPLHLLYDKHAGELDAQIDVIAERVQTLGGVCIAMGADAAETTLIPRVPMGREHAINQLNRLLHGHEIILGEARVMMKSASDHDDAGTNDLLSADVIRAHETQVWFLHEHVAHNDQ